jgi:hypothetical protein
MTSHLPEYNYLQGERQAELEDARVGDGRELWSPMDLRLLMTSEDLHYFIEWEGEALAEFGAEEFYGYGCGAAARNSSDALFLARQRMDAQYRRNHFGMSKSQVDAHYHRMFARAENIRKFAVNGGR